MKTIKLVTTINNKEVPRNLCKKIKNEYYIINTDCIQINNRWYSINAPYIKFDHRLQKWVRDKYNRLILGCIDYDPHLKTWVTGYFSMNLYEHCKCLVSNRKFVQGISYKQFRKFKELQEISFSDTILFAENDIDIQLYNNKLIIHTFPDNSYTIEESNILSKIKHEYNEYTCDINHSVKSFAKKYLKDISFGVEIETFKGLLPSGIRKELGIYICKDGSINYSPEYTSLVYSGPKGLSSLNKLFQEVNKFCTTNADCSLHYHFGNIRTDREFLIALYRLYTIIQIDLHKMLPFYKSEYYNIKKKDYNSFSPNIVPRYNTIEGTYRDFVTKYYKALFDILNEGETCSQKFNRKNGVHVNGDKKWNQSCRYWSLNFMNMFFSSRKTIEFRGHHAVLNPTKAMNWFMICLAIIKYAENYSSKILNSFEEEINFKDILTTIYSNDISEYLIAYYDERVQFHKGCKSTGDLTSKIEYSIFPDNYSFKHKGIESII